MYIHNIYIYSYIYIYIYICMYISIPLRGEGLGLLGEGLLGLLTRRRPSRRR